MLKYVGINTNNLKNINFNIDYNNIILLSGPSGAGKSSLAVDTIYKISEDELFQLMNRRDSDSIYTIREFSGILPSICLEQENFNSNPRSTIATYFNVSIYFQDIYAKSHHLSPTIFQFNKLDSACPKCLGLGTILLPDVFKLVDVFSPLSVRSFRRWCNTDYDFYKQVFELFCEEIGLDYRVNTFASLSDDIKNQLLYGESRDKYFIKFACNGKKRQRTAKFKGVIKELLENQAKTDHNKRYFSEQVCPLCCGGRFAEFIKQYCVNGKSLDTLYTMSMNELYKWMIVYKESLIDKNLLSPVNSIMRFLESIKELNIGYLSLNRSIPSLSGGELQRLRLAKAGNSYFSHILYVLDEPTAGIHPSEWILVSSLIKKLRDKSNTILIIDHNLIFSDIANEVYYIGPNAGHMGGEIVNSPCEHDISLEPKFFNAKKQLHIDNAFSHNVKLTNVYVALNSIVGICGVSGSGKTSFAKNIVPRYLPDLVYLDQEPIRGNAYSIIATTLGIMPDIQELFANSTRLLAKDFSFSSSSKGQCPECKGYGKITEGSSLLNTSFICPACGGKRFSEQILRYTFKGYNIYEFLSLELAKIINIIPSNTKIYRIISGAISCGLGYLTLFQETKTLSGGEAQRIKFVNTLFKGSSPKHFVLDEPFRGVDKSNTQMIMSLLYDLVKQNYSFFIIEHNLVALAFCSYLIEFGPYSGTEGGQIIYNGKTSAIIEAPHSIIASYLQECNLGFFKQSKDLSRQKKS